MVTHSISVGNMLSASGYAAHFSENRNIRESHPKEIEGIVRFLVSSVFSLEKLNYLIVVVERGNHCERLPLIFTASFALFVCRFSPTVANRILKL